jgi:hypothetical protein
MKKTIITVVIVAVVAGGGGYLLGKQGVSANQAQDVARFANFAAQGGLPGGQAGQLVRRGATGGGFVAGQIVAKDAASITVELRSTSTTGGTAGSKVVFFSASTTVMKSTSGTPADLTTGEQVVVQGTQNSDGSVTAESIQLGGRR